jgi:hypothetical protein
MAGRQFAVFGNGAEKKFVDVLLFQQDAITCTCVPLTWVIDINVSASAVPSPRRRSTSNSPNKKLYGDMGY